METPRIEEQTIDEVVNKVIDALVADVHFEKTWPAHTAYYQIDLNQFQKKLRQALTEAYQAGIDEAVEKIKGMKKKEYEYEHTFPNEIGVDMGNGYEKRISKGQKETLTYHLDEEELLYNQALDDTIKALRDNK